MAVSFQLPESIEKQLRQEFTDLDQAAKEAFAVDAYRAGNLSLGQFAEVLGISTYEADGLLKGRGIMLDLSDAELQQELAGLRELLKR